MHDDPYSARRVGVTQTSFMFTEHDLGRHKNLIKLL